MPAPATKPSPFAVAGDGLRVRVKVRPGARGAGVDGVAPCADGERALKVRVTAPAESGKANRALIALLAKEWRLPKGAVEVVAGASSRHKTLRLTGEPGALRARLEAWLEARLDTGPDAGPDVGGPAEK